MDGADTGDDLSSELSGEATASPPRCDSQIRIRVRYKQLATPWFDYLFVSETELRQIVDGTDWAIGDLVHNNGATYFVRLVKDDAVDNK